MREALKYDPDRREMEIRRLTLKIGGYYVIEDCKKTADELPVSEEAKHIVVLLTHEKTNDADRQQVMDAYYKATTEYGDAAWLLQYQIESMLDIYKRLM